MPKHIKIIIYIFIFLGTVIWQQVESVRKAYELRKYAEELARQQDLNTKLIFRLNELKSSKKLMDFAAANNLTFPKAEEIVYINLNSSK